MAQNVIEVKFDPQELAMLDEVRGETDRATFLHEIAIQYIGEDEEGQPRYTAEGELLIDGDEDLSPTDHIRMAAEAKTDSISLDEFNQEMDKLMQQLTATQSAEAAR